MSVSIRLMLPLAFVILFLIGILANVCLQDVIKIRDFDDKIENLQIVNLEQQIGLSTNNGFDATVSKEIVMDQLMDQVLMNYEFLEQYSSIDKRIQVAQPVAFCSDPTRLSVILRNLISNAIRYYDPAKDQPFIKVIGTVTDQCLHLKVADNGSGIPEDQLDKIFDMFYRASSQARGSGLGLFIVQETVNRMQGEITVSSGAGKGTVFQLTLPNLMAQQAKSPTTLIKFSNSAPKSLFWGLLDELR